MANRNIIVIATSAGGVEALSSLAGQLPAAILAVIHIPPYQSTRLDEVIGRDSRLKACMARHGQRIRAGSLYLAPPDHHMVMEDHQVLLTRGPHENRVRPAADPLFRSAAVAQGPGAIGVVLTGYLDDGTAGLAAIKRCGGIAVVQDPADAAYPDMPRSAIAAVEVDYTVPLEQLGKILEKLAHEPVKGDFQIPADLVREVMMSKKEALGEAVEEAEMEGWGKQVPVSCPECGGPLRERWDGKMRRYRCHTGHVYASRSLLSEQADKVEEALWEAVRTLSERARMLATLAEDEKKQGRPRSAKSYAERAARTHQQTQTLRTFLLGQDKAAG